MATTELTTIPQVIEDDRFEVIGKAIGNGCWGKVYPVHDKVTGRRDLAVKVFAPNEVAQSQMVERGWGEEEFSEREGQDFVPSSNIAPRISGKDKKDRRYIIQKRYGSFLSDLLDEDGRRRSLGNELLRPDQVVLFMTDITTGLSDLHRISHRRHGDIRPENIAVDGPKLLLNDLGTATCIYEDTANNVGFINTRAPENFKENEKCAESSDVYSAGALFYRFFTGKYPFEDELKSPGFDLSEKEHSRALRKKLKKVPRPFRGFLGKCLQFCSYDRYYNGEEMKKALQSAVEKQYLGKQVWQHIKRWTLPLTLSAAVLGYVGYKAETHEPQNLRIPPTKPAASLMGKPNKTDNIEFECEQITGLPKASPLGMMSGGLTKMAKCSTDNRVAAYLARAFGQANLQAGGIYHNHNAYSENQWDIFMNSTTPDERNYLQAMAGPCWPVWAKSIEFGLANSKTKGNRLDLEDTMAIALVGLERTDEAKRVSGSLNYADYREAKREDGTPVLTKREKNFINSWLAYYHAEIDD
ncbi:MAG: protein kinase [Candidatus Pacearchaeota archaeon]|nr:protein kinase [Candidatus Pacearchaeota archaeon]